MGMMAFFDEEEGGAGAGGGGGGGGGGRDGDGGDGGGGGGDGDGDGEKVVVSSVKPLKGIGMTNHTNRDASGEADGHHTKNQKQQKQKQKQIKMKHKQSNHTKPNEPIQHTTTHKATTHTTATKGVPFCAMGNFDFLGGIVTDDPEAQGDLFADMNADERSGVTKEGQYSQNTQNRKLSSIFRKSPMPAILLPRSMHVNDVSAGGGGGRRE